MAIAQNIYKEDHFGIMIEKYCTSAKIKLKQKLCEMDYVTGKFTKVNKLWCWYYRRTKQIFLHIIKFLNSKNTPKNPK